MPQITPDFSKQTEGEITPLDQPLSDVTDQLPPQAPAAEHPSGEISLSAMALRKQFGIGPVAAPSAPAAGTPHPAVVGYTQPAKKAPTAFHAAGQPAAPQEKELGWGDTLSQAGRNLIPSAGGTIGATYDALRHPVNTLNAIGDVGSGALSQAAGAIGIKQDPAEKAKSEALINALEDHYKQTYGSVAGFKKALAKDPTSILMDASTLLGGAGAAGKLAGVGKAAEITSKIGSAIDPVAQSVNLAKKVASIPIGAVRSTVSASSGVSSYLQKVAAAAGATENPELRAAFNKFYKGNGDPAEYLQTAQSAVQKARNEASEKYLATKGSLKGSSIDMQPILDHLDAADKGLQSGAAGGWPAAKDAAQRARALIEDVATHPNPAKRSLDEVDALKQQLNDLRGEYSGNPKATSYIDGAYKAVRDTLASDAHGGDSGYMKLMEEYQTARNGINDAQKTLGTGNTAAATASMMKGLRATKTAGGQSMLEELAKHEPSLPYMLAGHAANPYKPNLLRGMSDIAIGTALGYGVHPAAGAAAAMAASPHLVGGANYLAGRIAGPVGRAAEKIPVKGAYYTGRAQQENQPPGETAPEPATEAPAGVDPAIKAVEGTGKNPLSSAQGPYQMIDRTFEDQFRKQFPDRAAGMTHEQILALRSTPEGNQLSEQLGPKLIEQNKQALTNAGFDPTPGNTYLAHFLGADGAIGVLRAPPETPIEQLISKEAIDANERLLKGKTAGQVRQEMSNIIANANVAGGRSGRASGGRINDAHERRVNKLMQMFKTAKKEHNKTTKSLLDQPDESIVKALDVAQQAI